MEIENPGKSEAPLYDELFPALPTSDSAPLRTTDPIPSYKTRDVVEVIEIPFEERRYQALTPEQLSASEQSKTCTAIANSVGVKIELTNSEHKSLNVIITGEQPHVATAKQMIMQELQQQVTKKITVPTEYHRFLIGYNGEKKREIESNTFTRIFIPHPSKNLSEITIIGSPSKLANAEKEIQNIIQQRISHTVERVAIPKIYYPFINGPNNSTIDALKKRTNTKISVPFYHVGGEIVVSGKASDVKVAVAEINNIYKDKAERCITIPAKVEREKHGQVIGPKASGLHDILEKTGVSVEPPVSDSDEFTLRGYPEDLGRALSMVYSRITGPPKTETKAQRFHKPLTGRKTVSSAAIQDGNPHENEKIKDVIIEPRIQKLLRQGNPPKISEIEGEFREVVIRWPEIELSTNQRRNNAPISGTKNEEISPSSYIVQLCGLRDQVDAAATKLDKLIKNVKAENQEQEVRIFKDCLDRLMGTTIINLLKETNTRIHYMPPSADGSVLVTIIGRQENVENAVQRLEKLQKALVDIKEITIQLPPMLVSKYADGSASRLRSIREQCEGIQLQTKRTQPRQLTISGPPGALEKAKSLIDSMCAKLAERCADVTVYADPKFHPHLIGRNGVNLTRFREKHDVEVLFPDRLESDPKLASEIHIIGEKDAVAKAQEAMEASIKALGDEVESSVACESSLVKELMNQRSAFQYPELERAKVIWPRGFNSPPARRQQTVDEPNGEVSQEPSENVSIRIYGAKANVEAAEQRLISMIEDVKAQITVKHPLTEVGQCQAISRHRSLLLDMQRNYNVFINCKFNYSQRGGDHDYNESEGNFGHIVLTGRAENIENVLKRELLPLLPISEKITFPQEFYGKLIQIPQPINKGKHNAALKSTPSVQNHAAARNGRNFKGTENNAVACSDVPPSRLIELQQKFNVHIILPPRNSRDDHITIRGPTDNVEKAKVELAELLKEFETEKSDWLARTHEEYIEVEDRFVPRILNERTRLNKTYGVTIFASNVMNNATNSATSANDVVAAGPKKELEAEKIVENSEVTENRIEENGKEDGEVGDSYDEHEDSTENEEEEDEKIAEKENNGDCLPSMKHLNQYRLCRSRPIRLVIQGYKEKAQAAKAELISMVEKFATFCCEELHIPAQVHARLIGYHRSAIHRLEEEYSVDVEFPRRGTSTETADIVLVLGAPENVDAACDELINKANDLMERFPDIKEPNPSTSSNALPRDANDFAIRGAPWEH